MKLVTTLFCVLMTNVLFACDFCGCFMGITPYDNQSSITIMYRYKSFNGYNFSGQHNNLFPQTYKAVAYNNNTTTNNLIGNNYQNTSIKHGGSTTTATTVTPQYTQKDYELFTSAELRGKFFIHKRIELNAIIPFIMNSNRIDDDKHSIEGIGDISFFAGYHIIDKTMTEKFQHRLIVGAGIKLPVGNYYAKNDEEERIDFMLQPGTGSMDYMTYVNYIFSVKKIGLNINSIYKFNGYNYYHEEISNSSSTYLNIFYKFREDKNLKIFPSLQGYYEHSKGEYIYNEYQPGTAMSVATAGIGVDVFYKNISLNTSFQLPVYEKKLMNNLATAGKFMIGLTYSFDQKKYLIKKKEH